MAFNPSKFKAPEAKKLPVVLLLDISTSMSGEKNEHLYQSVCDMLATFSAMYDSMKNWVNVIFCGNP